MQIVNFWGNNVMIVHLLDVIIIGKRSNYMMFKCVLCKVPFRSTGLELWTRQFKQQKSCCPLLKRFWKPVEAFGSRKKPVSMFFLLRNSSKGTEGQHQKQLLDAFEKVLDIKRKGRKHLSLSFFLPSSSREAAGIE